jgi:hypothetical protein
MKPKQELLHTIEQIRAEKFGDIPADLVSNVVNIERDFTENRQEAYKRIEHAIDAYLEKTAAAAKSAG